MILVVGSTGLLGGMITRKLLAQGLEVRILVRPPSDYQPLVDVGGQPVYGDLKDRASLDAACAGVDVVITTANSAQRGGEDNVETVDRLGNRSLIDAACEAGVKQFIFVSAMGSVPDSPVPFISAKGQTEEHLRRSGMTYTILTPGVFLEVWGGMIIGYPLQQRQPITLVGNGSAKQAFVSVEDVAAFAVAAVDNPAAANRTITICGPKNCSWRELVTAVGNVLQVDLPVNFVSPGSLIPGFPETVGYLMADQESRDTPDIDMTEAATTFHVRLTSVEEYAQRTFGGAA